jgi:Ser/Thr protein kinase RdoA (MazF antagonist)
MGKTLVPADWAPLTDEEVSLVLGGTRTGAVVTWHSPRPMSAAGLVSWRGASLVVKRHHLSVRTVGQLHAEHAFAGYLRARGLPVPAVVPLHGGVTAVRRGDFSYEAQRLAAGIDLYRDAVSWSPFAALGHARSAGAALARLHRAAEGYAAPARPPGVLISSCAVILATDPVGRVARILARRPGLSRWMARRPWRDDFTGHLLPAIHRAGPLGRTLPRQWGHGDWHPSNLSWTGAGPDARVAGVFDLGLANRTFAVHDLALAIERSTVTWLDLAESGQASADLEAIDTLLDGYESVRPLTPAEATALPEVLPVAHVEFALSEVEYFADVTGSAANAELAYDGYLLGHARWFAAPAGAEVLDHLRQRSGRGPD